MKPNFRILLLFSVLSAVLLIGCSARKEVAVGPVAASFSPSDSIISVTWPSVPDAAHYRIFRKTAGSEFRFLDKVTECEYTDTDIFNGSAYEYKVEVSDGTFICGSSVSAPVSIPGTPEVISAKRENGIVSLSWTASSGPYAVYSSPDGTVWKSIAETSQTFCSITSDASFFRIRSCAGLMPDSSVRIPDAPELLSVTRLDKYTAAVLFKPVSEAYSYEIFRVSADGNRVSVGFTDGNSFYDQCRDNNVSYAVRSISSSSESDYSSVAEIGFNGKSVFGIPVMMYHEFVTQEDLDHGVLFDEYAITASEFEEDLLYLAKNGYHTITCSQLIGFLDSTETLPGKPILLTIDDGKLGVYKHAFPLLKKHGMTASLAVILEMIDDATESPQNRVNNEAPYCTWGEIRSMSDSGTIEIISHTYHLHRYQNEGRIGAAILDSEPESVFYHTAIEDYSRTEEKLKKETGSFIPVLSYPYSECSEASDRVWMNCGYRLFLCGNSSDVRPSFLNYYAQGFGLNANSVRTRRMPRMTGTPIRDYLEDAIHHDS